MKAPCLGCTERRPGCHGRDRDNLWICAAWGGFQDECERERQKREADRERDASSMGYRRESYDRYKRRERNRNTGR